MYNDHITVQFSHQEKWELQKCMHFVSVSTDAKFSQNKNISEKLKEDIVGYIRQSQKKIEEHARIMELVKDLFIEKKVYPKRGKDYHYEMKKDEVYDCIKKLKILFSEKDRDSQCCTIYANVFNELSNLTPQKLPSFDKNVNQAYKIMSYQQRDNISKVAHNLIKAGQSGRKLHIVEQVSSFFTKINRYGANEEYPQLSKIEDEELRLKMIKMVEQLKQNYVEIEPVYYYRDQSIKDFINKLSNNLYSKEQMKKRMKYLNPKVQILLDPLFNELYRLRESSDSTQRSMQYSSSQKSFASNKNGRSSHEDGIGQVISDLAEYKKKNDELTNEIKELKWFISIVNYRGASEDRQIVKEVKSFIAKYKSQDMGRELEKLYQGKKQVQPRELGFKKKTRAFQENISEEKLNNEIFILKAEVAKLKEENEILNHKTYENIDERIELLNKIQTLQSQKNNAEDSRIKNEQEIQLRILDIEMRLKQTQKKYDESESDLESLRFSNNELTILLEQKQKEIVRIRQQGLLYEKTIVDLQNEQTAKLIEEENKLETNNRVEELENELIYQKARVEQKTERIDELQSYLTVKIDEIRQEKDEELRIQKQAKNEEINLLNKKIGQLEGRQMNEQSVDLSNQVFELATRNQQFALQIQMLISAKDLALKSSIQVAQEKEKIEMELSDIKEKFYFANIQKQQLQEETKKLRSQMTNFNKTKYEELLLKNQQLELKGKQYIQSNINLKRQMNELLANQILQKDMSKSQKGISMEEYQNMQNEMLQMNKITLMIRDEYKKFKNQMSNVVKHKIQVEKSVFKANQKKLRDNYEQARDNFFVLQGKVDTLEKQNQSLKQDIQILKQEFQKMNKVEAHNFSFSQEKQQKDNQIASLTQKYQSLQSESEAELNRKDEQLSELKLQILQLKNELESAQNLIHENSILQQRMSYMQEQIQQYCRNISFYKQEIEQKNQQIITLKIDVLESQVDN